MTDLNALLDIIGPALIGGLLVLITHIHFGREVLKRGIIFLDIAIAQVAALGVMLGIYFELEHNPVLIQLVAVSSALIGAAILHATEKRYPDIQESIIGSVFILAATGSLLLLADNPHAGAHFQDLLSGQILWIEQQQLVSLAIVTVLMLCFWKLAPMQWQVRLFYPAFAIVITTSVQVVGIYLVFASLIIPALAVYHQSRYQYRFALLLGAAGYALGLLLSTVYDLPAGPLIVWMLVVLALCYRFARHYLKIIRQT